VKEAGGVKEGDMKISHYEKDVDEDYCQNGEE